MRCLIVVVTDLFLASASLGCGGASIPTAPTEAKAGPPPGTSPEMTKVIDTKATKKK